MASDGAVALSGKAEEPHPRLVFWLSFVKDIFPIMTTICGGLWVIHTYLQNQATEASKSRDELVRQNQLEREQTRVRAFEARKAYLDKQLTLYFELSKLVGQLLVLEPKSDEWQAARTRFLEIGVAEVWIVGEADLAQKAENFADALRFIGIGSLSDGVKRSGQDLVKALGRSIESSWKWEA